MNKRHHDRARALVAAALLPFLAALFLNLSGCAERVPVRRSVHGENFQANHLLQSDANRFANLVMRDNWESLERLLDKLYQRNPAMWRRTGARTLEQAHAAVMQAIRTQQPLPGLDGAQGVTAMFQALSSDCAGDRAGALIYGMGSMLVQAYDGHLEVKLVHGMNAQKIANAAHNVMVAAWILAQRTGSDGKPLLLSNEISVAGRNLSFEREIGKIIGRLDTLAAFVDEKYRRTMIDYAQGLAAGPLLQFIPIEAATSAIP